MLSRIEKQLKRRFAIGSQVSEHSIIQDFTKQVGLPGGWVEVGERVQGVSWWPPSHLATSVWLLSRQAAGQLFLILDLLHLPLGQLQSQAEYFPYSITGRGQVLMEPHPGFPQPFPFTASSHCLSFVGWGRDSQKGEFLSSLGTVLLTP